MEEVGLRDWGLGISALSVWRSLRGVAGSLIVEVGEMQLTFTTIINHHFLYLLYRTIFHGY